MNPLHWAARNGPLVLVAGLVGGLLLPGLAEPMRPMLPPLVVLLLFVTVLRMEPSSILGSMGDWRLVSGTVLGFQFAIPLAVLAVGFLFGWNAEPVLLALLIMTAAPSITGSPNLCLMMGYPAEHAMRLLVAGTAVLPLTVFPIFWLMPEIGDFHTVLQAVLKLFVTIFAATFAAIALRRTVLKSPSQGILMNLEGLGTITLAVFVVGLMPSVSSTMLERPGTALFWIAFACCANFGAQAVTYVLTRNRLSAAKRTAMALIAGNRNIAIFFVALPPEVTAPLMVFIGAYQIPMYLTPTVMRRLYRAG
ncbi:MULTISPECIES: hypothetical protein [unclassified Ruegeria]|uniref:hypothetical protein n=1 Tax=unclassified Ruegeria TaxID=2625375 RepID=UPI0014893320|nr:MULTISPECIES: hypothetical protein [unclassified Ruegeria]